MAKESGLGMTVAVDDDGGSARSIENDVTSVQIGTPNNLQDITGVDKSAIERLLLLADGAVSLSGVVNTAANQQHDVFKSIGVTEVIRTVTIVVSGQTLPMEMVVQSYNMIRADDGSLGWTATLALANGTVPTWA